MALHTSSGYIGSPELENLAAVRLLAPGEQVPDEVVARAREGNPAVRAVTSVALLESGDAEGARELLGPPPSSGASDYGCSPHVLAHRGTEATGPPDDLAAAVSALEPYTGTVACYGTVDHLGAVDYFLALGHHALGDPRAAAEGSRGRGRAHRHHRRTAVAPQGPCTGRALYSAAG